MSENTEFEQLRNAIETAVDRKMKSPRDFDFLAETIYEKLHQSISTSTLKRFWGYLPQYATIRTSTLDLLSQFVDYKDWEAFRLAQKPSITSADTPPINPVETGGKNHHAQRLLRLSVLAMLAVLLLGGTFLLGANIFRREKDNSTESGQAHILRRGQIFKTCNDYLRLFGVTASEHWWDEPLPHHEGIIIWGPEFHHPNWHNDGQPDSLMPTITEWWTPADSLNGSETSDFENLSEEERQLLTEERNAQLYFTVMRTNELRITFMKNLVDTGYVFLGIYRTTPTQSDSTHIVWERIADECDLCNLDYLQQLRH